MTMNRLIRRSLTVIAVLLLSSLSAGGAMPVQAQDSPYENKKIVPFVPTPQDVVDKMIELGGVIWGRMPSGKIPVSVVSRSCTVCRAARTSVVQSNSM